MLEHSRKEAIVDKNRCCYRVLRALAPLLIFVLLAPPRPVLASEDGANASAEAAGRRARFAEEFCADSAQDVATYKEKLRKVLTDASQFEFRWQAGWQRGNNDAIPMRSLQLSSPAEFAVRVKSNCERIKWQADNLLRAHPAR
jgi:hypothetical protein